MRIVCIWSDMVWNSRHGVYDLCIYVMHYSFIDVTVWKGYAGIYQLVLNVCIKTNTQWSQSIKSYKLFVSEMNYQFWSCAVPYTPCAWLSQCIWVEPPRQQFGFLCVPAGFSTSPQQIAEINLTWLHILCCWRLATISLGCFDLWIPLGNLTLCEEHPGLIDYLAASSTWLLLRVRKWECVS